MSAQFKVGGQVVALKSHMHGFYKKGDLFPLQGIRLSQCKCADIELDVGLKIGKNYNQNVIECARCHVDIPTFNSILWVGHKHFAPIDTTTSETTSEDILNEIEELELKRIL